MKMPQTTPDPAGGKSGSREPIHEPIYEPIYKVTTAGLWAAARRDGVLAFMPVDDADGYMHFSTASQLRETLARHFAGQGDLVLVAADPAALGDGLKWEVSRGGALFPHLYGAGLPLHAVLSAQDIAVAEDGSASLPAGVP